MTDSELLSLAKKASMNAYVPYSRFPVGAALECEDGTVFTGCNVENAALGTISIAGRSALTVAAVGISFSMRAGSGPPGTVPTAGAAIKGTSKVSPKPAPSVADAEGLTGLIISSRPCNPIPIQAEGLIWTRTMRIGPYRTSGTVSDWFRSWMHLPTRWYSRLFRWPKTILSKR